MKEEKEELMVEAARANDLARVRQLLAEGVDAEAKNQFCDTALCVASYYGHLEIVQLLVERGARVNLQEKFRGDTALHWACRGGHLEVIKWLMEHGADHNIKEKDYKMTPLRVACLWCNSGVIIQLLVEKYGADVHSTDRRRGTCLQAACESGRWSAVHFLIKNGAKVNARNDIYETALHIACRTSRGKSCDFRREVVTLLLKHGADVHAKDVYGRTPLWIACESSPRLETVTLLIAFGADIDSTDNCGLTPLSHYCQCYWDDDDMVIRNFLIKHGANVNAKAKDSSWYTNGKTALHFASMSGSLEMIQLLVENGANLNALDGESNTPLHVAYENRHFNAINAINAIQLLIEKGAEMNIKDKHGKTPLHLACESGRVKIAKLLLTMDTSSPILQVNAQDNDGNTPLYLACRNGDLELMGLLLSRGANVHVETTQGLTALAIASERSRFEVVWCLVNQYPSLVVFPDE